jgi:hypothetical protein
MRAPTRTPLPASPHAAATPRAAALRAAATTLTAALALAACGSVVVPPASGSHPSSPASGTRPAAARSAPAGAAPPAGSRPAAAALARQLLSRLRLPSGARRLAPEPLPPSLSQPASQYATGPASLDQHQLFALTQPVDAAAAFLAAHIPPGLSRGGTGEGSSPGGVTMREVTDTLRSLPSGISAGELVLTVVPAASGGSLLRADAQVVWFPPRTAAEYLDPARYHVLTITATVYGQRMRTVRKVVTSPAVIARLAAALNRSPVTPAEDTACPNEFATYRLALSVSRSSRPAVVVQTAQWPCGGSTIIVNGRPQPPLADNGAVAALADQVLGIAPHP